MSDDKAKHKILPPSKFGLVQITRQRVRPEVNIKTREEDPNDVNGEIEAYLLSINISDLERVLKITKSLYLTYIHLCTHTLPRFSIITFKMVF
jgi:ribonuclease G